jgi:broad specificity phosphatase PhoE
MRVAFESCSEYRPATRVEGAEIATELVLIRHAHVAANSVDTIICGWHDPPLSSIGEKQVAQLQDTLRHSRFAAVYSSDLVRARQTAVAAANEINAVRYLRSLREIHCGDCEGVPIAEVQKCDPDLWCRNLAQNDPDFRWPGGESYRSFRSRVITAITGIASRHPGEKVAIVTHAGVVSQLLGLLHGQPACVWESHRPGNASLTRIGVTHGRADVLSFDERLADPSAVEDKG